MKKKASALLCMMGILGMIFLFSGCGGEEKGPACIDIVRACSAAADKGTFDTWTGYGETLYEDSFSTMYGIQYDMLKDGAILYTQEGGKADEISIMRLKNMEDLSLVKEKLSDRIAERKHLFEGYKPEEVSKLDSAYVIAQDNYVALLIGDQNQKLETQIRTAISQGVE